MAGSGPLYAVLPVGGRPSLVSHRHNEDSLTPLQIYDTEGEPSEAYTTNPSGRGRLVTIYGLEELPPSLRKEREIQH
jgi:hypothetical protein